MRRTFQKRLLVPEGGNDRKFKRFLLSYGWRVCTDCGLRRRKRGLELRVTEQGVHWLCVECRKKLIHHRWTEEVEQGLTAMYNINAERVLLETLRRFGTVTDEQFRQAQQAVPPA